MADESAEIRISKRMVVWLLERSCEVLLLYPLLYIFSTLFYGPTRGKTSAREVIFILVGISVLFMAKSGYLLTTAILRILWTNRTPWLHPAISVALFLIHLQVFFFATGGVNLSERLAIRAGGACIVFSCTFVGGYVLRSWERPSSG
jgi:hypothetical protein